MATEDKKRRGIIILGLGLTFTFLVLGGAWLWLERDNIAWSLTDARFAKHRDTYASWNKTCPDGLETNAAVRAGITLVQPDALECRFNQVSATNPEDWPGGELEHRIEIAGLAAKLYLATHKEEWLLHRPCNPSLPFNPQRIYASAVNQRLFNVAGRQQSLIKLPDIYVSAVHHFFDCKISNEEIHTKDYLWKES